MKNFILNIWFFIVAYARIYCFESARTLFYWFVDSYYLVKERISRSTKYAIFGWTNYDFDFEYTWDLLEFKLKRIRETLKDCGISETHMEALDETIKLCGRLKRDSYDAVCTRNYFKKYPGYFKNNRVSSKSTKKSREEFEKCCKKSIELKNKDLQKLFENIKTSSVYWWD